MTPTEKAKALVEKFSVLIPFSEYDKHHQSEHAKKCKQCALICVDEIWKALKPHDDLPEINAHYWQSVKIEIEKL